MPDDSQNLKQDDLHYRHVEMFLVVAVLPKVYIVSTQWDRHIKASR